MSDKQTQPTGPSAHREGTMGGQLYWEFSSHLLSPGPIPSASSQCLSLVGLIGSETSVPLWHLSRTCIAPMTNQQKYGRKSPLLTRNNTFPLCSLLLPGPGSYFWEAQPECLCLGLAPSYLGQEQTRLVAFLNFLQLFASLSDFPLGQPGWRPQ